jgi:pyruvate,water dikinase
MRTTQPFTSIGINDIPSFGGKNASLGEMTQHLAGLGINIPEGFAISSEAFWKTLKENGVYDQIENALATISLTTLEGLSKASATCRSLIDRCEIPGSIALEILEAYHRMGSPAVAVRSSATAEDLPTASFAGQHESYLNIQGDEAVLAAVKNCYRSLYTERAIKYRIDNGFEHIKVALSAGVQRMVRSDMGSAGVAFTLDPETGFRNVIYITGAWGLGETIVQGAVNPDEFVLFKPTLFTGKNPLLRKVCGAKRNKLIYGTDKDQRTILVETTTAEQQQYVIREDEVIQLGKWCADIEKHYKMPMDIEWAKDGVTGELFILQARPETVHAQHKPISLKEYKLKNTTTIICSGTAVGHAIVSGPAKIIRSLEDGAKVNEGDILVAEITHPDWNTLLRKAVCIITDKGGRTSHASIVARELGITAVVGTENATTTLVDGQIITVSTASGDTGQVYQGKLEWSVIEVPIINTAKIKTTAMLILADPSKAFHYAFYPAKGIGLLRMEFIITNSIRIHPMALLQPEKVTDKSIRQQIDAITEEYANKKEYFIDQLASSVGMMAAAFYPNDVIVRMSDFKTNEYADLIGGKYFEPQEENPMLGFRGASRYYRDAYKSGFGLECDAIRRVRDKMGLTNVKVMIPFCRTVDEGKKVLQTMKEFGLERGENGLEVYVMAEIPSNVVLADEFAEIFDGFSIGSNDLTQLTLGIDRDTAIISDLFDENNPAVLQLLQSVISKAKKNGRKIGLCGQVPSDKPEFARFLVNCGIDSISFNPDALLEGIENIAAAEKEIKKEHETITA